MNSLEIFQARIKRVLPRLQPLSPLLEKRFLNPYRVWYIPDLPVERDDGSIELGIKAWLVFWWNSWGSASNATGGTRMDPEVSEVEVATLAGTMFIKLETMGVPWGAAKFGIRIPPDLSPTERKKTVRSAISAIRIFLGEHKYFPGPDMGTGDLIGVMVDEFAKHAPPWANPLKTFSGKPTSLLGLGIRRESTGLGGVYGIKNFIAERLTGEITSLKNAKIICQGFGQVIQPFLKYAAQEQGAKIIAVSDISETLYCEDGLDIPLLLETMQGKRVLAEAKFPGEHLPPETLFSIPSDIDVYGARENQLTEERARQRETKLVVELANFPTTLDAEDVLEKRGIPVLPDGYASGGGVSVSYDERAKGDHWGDERYIRAQLETTMRAKAKEIAKIFREEKLNRLRDALILFALHQAITRHKARGADFKEEGL
jgi:glutamate dehydrogenase/leucine dehydrogenase